MGTLTANLPRLEDHCPHKLPTSCRLTATPRCCACDDKRPHSSSYRIYIDGVGFVPRGTRWQNYCWFCSEFWSNRLAACNPPLLASDTRIPEVPDQTAFLERWFEFHQGFHIVTRQDGTEERIAVLGESFKDVSPGYLPRTLEELRGGAIVSASHRDGNAGATRAVSEENAVETSTTLDETLDSLLAEANSEVENRSGINRSAGEQTTQTQSVPENAPGRDIMSNDISQLLIEIQILSDRIQRLANDVNTGGQEIYREMLEGLAGIIERFSPSQQTPSLSEQTSDRLQETGRRVIPSPPQTLIGRRWVNRMRIQYPIDAHRPLQEVERQTRSTQNAALVYGTREEVERQGESYESPITGLFNRAWGRYREAEEQRAQPGGSTTHTPRRVSASLQRTYGFIPGQFGGPRIPVSRDSNFAEYLGFIGQNPRSTVAQPTNEDLVSTYEPRIPVVRSVAPTEPRPSGLDDDNNRPEGKTEEEMTLKLECKVCYTQIANIAVLPCGHMAMCQWCADIHIPVREHDKTVPRNKQAKCPICRAKVSKRVKIHV
ncbi:hypothetical protein M501DRAFT_996504 [Patellaria atrata CBS 101060]|uniref:RING-type domain-containing protein n=1 Tax=Patellaria atrata CBS 101060 TaxID=1346257 RepID=A0A9P4S6W1_9PEZI|nr:hypothetical protein M501DRAFT_996504 [Patellaria atrata CBS 101060]